MQETLDQQDEVRKLLEEAESQAASVVTLPEERGGFGQKSNLIKSGNIQLPERLRVFRRLSGREAWLPTATIGYHMGKRHTDGSKVFVRTIEECRVQPKPIDKTCDICLSLRNVRKVFYSMYDYEAHQEFFHTRELRVQQREEDREERKQERELMMAAIQGRQPESVTSEPATVERTAAFVCQTCGFVAKNAFGLRAHERSHGTG